jgi:hypothetical protein
LTKLESCLEEVRGKDLEGNDWIKGEGPFTSDPDIDSLVSVIATYEKTSMSAAIEKLMFDPNLAVLPAPDAPNEIHYSMTIGGSRVTVQMLKTAALRDILQKLKADDHKWQAQS